MEEHKHHEGHEHNAHHEGHIHHKPTIKLWVMAAAIGLLIILSGIQAVELVSLKSKLDKEITSLGSSKSAVSTGSSGLKDNLKNLPSMVGGC
ncbi:MAG: hypothetical protein Q8R04_06495 [Nanoarchaeota archaeon]|nr:hypothetical protein [Nanoarchaeota archaeon]